MPPIKKVTPATDAGPNFGALDFYSGGFLLAPGLYAMMHDIVMHQPTDAKTNVPKGPARLGVMLSATPITETGEKAGEPQQQFLSMGTKAHESYLPNESGKGLQAVIGGPGNVTNKANWWYYLESLYNSGLPQGIFTNDVSVLDGVWVRTDNIPEPEERKGYAKAPATGEVQQDEVRGNNKMPVVTEILDGGKPWEGSGGVPEGEVAAAKPGPKAVAPKTGPKPVAKVTAKAPAPVEADDEAVKVAAINGITSVLEKAQYQNGCPKIILKTGTFKAVTEGEGGDMAQSVQNTFFASDEALNALLNEMGYALAGNQVKPQA